MKSPFLTPSTSDVLRPGECEAQLTYPPPVMRSVPSRPSPPPAVKTATLATIAGPAPGAYSPDELEKADELRRGGFTLEQISGAITKSREIGARRSADEASSAARQANARAVRSAHLDALLLDYDKLRPGSRERMAFFTTNESDLWEANRRAQAKR